MKPAPALTLSRQQAAQPSLLSVALLTISVAALSHGAIAQSCDASTGGGGGATGSACVETRYCVTSPDSSMLSVFARPLPTGESFVYNQVEVVPGSATSPTDINQALGLVSNGGLVMVTGGEFRQTVGLIKTYGYDGSHPLLLSLNYRSYEVDQWRNAGDGVGTSNDPFGPGWRASWGDMLVEPNPEGTEVTRIDEYGVRWTHQAPQSLVSTVVATRNYSAQAGVRIVREYRTDGTTTWPAWFKEWPDRTRLEYAATSGSGANLVAKRMYRGDYDAPDWSVNFSYSGGRLVRIQDARGVVHNLSWASFGGAERVTKIETRVPTAWSTGWPGVDFNFEYETTSPYRLLKVRRPARKFVDDQDRSGAYDTVESFNQELVTSYVYHTSSSRLRYVYDESTGLARQMLEVAYDSSPSWRVITLTEGESSSLPGQGQKLQTFSYPQANETGWVDARGVTRHYTFDQGWASPKQWRVTRIVETAGANDPRPSSDPNFHASLAWEFTWACGCGQMASVKMPSLLTHQIDYDTEGRGLVVATRTIPSGSGAAHERTWTYTSWNESDYRLASRLTGYTDALTKVGTNTFTLDPTYGGYRIDGTFAGIDLFSVQEDAGGRVVWTEEGTFQVDGGGTSRARTGFQVGTNSAAADYMLTKQADSYQGGSIYSSHHYTYGGLGWMLTEIDELSRTTTLTYDSVGWLRQAALPTTSSGRGSGAYAGTFTFDYDRYGQVAISTQNAVNDQGSGYGRSVIKKVRVFDYFSRPWKELTDVADLNASGPQNLTTTYEYDEGARLVRVLASGGRETQYLIDDHNRLYQERRRLDASTWSVEQHGFHEDGVLARVVEPTGLVGTVDTLDVWGRPEQIHLPGDKHIWLTRDAEDRVTESEYRTGSGGSQLQQTVLSPRDDLGRVTTKTVSAPGLATSRSLTYTYNGPSRVGGVVDGDDRGASYGYDALGRLVRKQDRLLGASGNAEVFTRDQAGNVTRVDHVEQRQTGASSYSPVTYRTDLAYDTWDRLIRAEFWGSASGIQFTRYRGYDSLGNATWSKDGVGKEARREYDAAGRIVNEWLHQRNAGATPIQLSRSYDDAPTNPLLSAGLTRTDGIGNISEYRYDQLGRMVGRTLPGNKQWAYSYDLAARLTDWVDGNGTHVQQVYDSERRLKERRVLGLPTNGVYLSPMATNETWAYDDFDRVVSATTSWQSYPYLGGATPPTLVEAVDAYDGIGRQNLERFNYLGVISKDLTYAYTKAGGGEDASMRRLMSTSAGWQIGTTPDGAGKVSSMTLSGPSTTQQPLADWRYEGNRPIRRGFSLGAVSTTEMVSESVYNQLRHMVQTTTTRFVNGVADQFPTYDLQLDRDAEGNVFKHLYAKAAGGVGDWFQLDGWDRLQEAKLGVTAATIGGTYGAAVSDRKITYALDEAHNRASVADVTGSTTSTTTYHRRADTNEYEEVIADGDAQKWLYDDNGNLLSDGYYLYVYDHLDRLSEVYLLTYPGGATKMMASGEEVVQVYDKNPQSKRDGKETFVPLDLWRQQVSAARQRVAQARQSSGTASTDPRPPLSSNANTSGTSAAAVNESMPLLIAIYGYDPSNRRIGKMLGDGGGAFYAWSGWDLIEAYDIQFQPSTVFFEGGVIDEHLGYAWRDPVAGNWKRYGYVQDHTRGIATLVDESGAVVERYEYDPYGKMVAFAPDGSKAPAPTVRGQAYGFTGRQVDPETGLLYYRYRYYQPHHGRFLSHDPGGAFLDALAHGGCYSYVGSCPHALVDPSGLFTTVVVVAPANPTPAQQAEIDRMIEAATNTAATDPEGGEIIIVDAADGKGEVRGNGARPVPPRKQPGKPPTKWKKRGERKTNKLVVMLTHGDAPEMGSNLATDHDATHGNMVIEAVVRGHAKFDEILVSACWLATKPRTDDPEDLRRNMAYRLALLGVGPVLAFDCVVMRHSSGRHVLKDDTADNPDDNPDATPVPVDPK